MNIDVRVMTKIVREVRYSRSIKNIERRSVAARAGNAPARSKSPHRSPDS